MLPLAKDWFGFFTYQKLIFRKNQVQTHKELDTLTANHISHIPIICNEKGKSTIFYLNNRSPRDKTI